MSRAHLMRRVLGLAVSGAATIIVFAALLEAVFVLGGYLPVRAW